MFRDGFGVLGHSGRNIKVGRREARASPSITYQPLGKTRLQVIKKVNVSRKSNFARGLRYEFLEIICGPHFRNTFAPPAHPMDHRRRSYTVSTKRVSRKQNKRGYREFKRNAWTPQLNIAGQGQINRRDGIPPSMLQKLRYSGVTQISVAGTAYAEAGLSFILDPYGIFSAGLPTNHQPTLFDQFMTLYTNYRVRAYKVRVQAASLPDPPATATSPTIAYFGSVVVPPGVVGGPLTAYIPLAQDSRGKSGICQRADAGITTHKHYYSLQSLSGNVDPTDDAYTGSSTASPPLVPTMNLVGKGDATALAANISVQIDVKFYVEFFNPLTVLAS